MLIPGWAHHKSLYIKDTSIPFFFNDLTDNKKKKYVTMDIDKFVQQVLIHLPPNRYLHISFLFDLFNFILSYRKKTLSKNWESLKILFNLSYITLTNSGTNTSETIDINLIKIFNEGPDVSLHEW